MESKLCKIGLLVFVLLVSLCPTIVSASSYENITSDEDWGCDPSVSAGWVKVNVTDSIVIKGIFKTNTSLAIGCELTDTSHEILYDTGTFSDDYCAFSGIYQLSPEQEYIIVLNISVSGDNYCYKDGALVGVVNSGIFNWIDSGYESGGWQSDVGGERGRLFELWKIEYVDIVSYNTTFYNTSAIPYSWSEGFDISTTSGMMILFFYLALIVVTFTFGMMCRIPLLVFLSAVMMFFLGFMIAFKLSILFGILVIAVALALAVVGALMI